MARKRGMAFGRFDYAMFAGFFAYAAGSLVVPVALVQLARDLRFTLDEGGMSAAGALHLGRTVPLLASLLLCGVAAGRWGKRRTLGWAMVLVGLGMALCAVARSYDVLFVALLVAGLGEGVVEGMGTPFVEALHPEEPGRYINFSHGFWSVGVVATTLATGALLSNGVSWRVAIGAVSCLAAVPALLALLPQRPGREYPEHPEPVHWTVVRDHAWRIVRTGRFWLFFGAMFAAGGGEFCLTFWCASYIQLHFTAEAWAGGLGTAFFAAGMVLGRTGWGYLIHQRHLPHLVTISAVAGTAVTLLFPVLANLWVFFGLLFLAGLATAPFWPSLQSYSADRMPQADSTMLYILLACAGIPGCGVATWLMGLVGNRYGLSVAFYLVPGCYGLLAGLAGTDWWLHRRASAH